MVNGLLVDAGARRGDSVRPRSQVACTRRARSRVTSPVPVSRAACSISGSITSAGVDRDRDKRQVFRQGQRPVGARVPARAEPLGAAQQDAGGDLVPPVQVEQRVGGEPARRPLPLAEVTGQLDGVAVRGAAVRSAVAPMVAVHGAAVHRAPPISRPSAAAATPRTRLTTMFATALRYWPLLGEPLRLQHPGGEGGVGADRRRSGEQRRVVAEREPGQQPERHRARQVHDQRAVREVAPGRRGDQAVHVEPQHGAGTADEDHRGPDEHAHRRAPIRRTGTLRTSAVARCSAA